MNTITYNYCKICGRVPHTAQDEPNFVRRFWSPDDGWIIGALCRWCHDEFGDAKPKPEDFAYNTTNHVCDDDATDEDASQFIG